MKKLYISLVLLCLAVTGFTQIRMTMVDPVNHQIQIKNFGMMVVDISTYRLCALFDYQALNQAAVTIVTGDFNLSASESVTLIWNNAGANGGFLGTASDVGLYLPSGGFGNPTNMVDFMQYGAAGQGRENVADSADIWNSGDFLLTSTGPWMYTGDGTQNGMMFWVAIVPGCMDVAACNYNMNATESDSSCTYPGCTAALACNYDSIAGCDDGSCSFPGCTDTLACNYDSTAGCDNGLCILPNGCTNALACNYDSTATCDNGSCILPNGCTDTLACNFDSLATCDNGLCVLPNGCTDALACNYDSTATCDNGSCIFPNGCTDSLACNFDSLATCDDGSCLMLDACGTCGGNGILGCTDSLACNYNTFATCSDSSCVGRLGCIDSTACNYDTLATCDNGSCSGLNGCIDSTACNFNEMATCDNDNSCDYPVDFINCSGECLNDADSNGVCDEFEPLTCSDPTAFNYNPLDTLALDDTCYFYGCNDYAACNYNNVASVNDSTCIYPGCTDSLACNYDAVAGCNDNSCTYPGCSDTLACNYISNAGCPDSCTYALPLYTCEGICINDIDQDSICDESETLGCTNLLACNYDSLATLDNDSCVFPGCLDEVACNYDEFAGCNDSSCLYPGCTDTLACNFDIMAGCDDSSCIQFVDECGVCGGNGLSGCTDALACNYDSLATCDDENCTYPAFDFIDCDGACLNDSNLNGICDELELGGCTDFMACNFDFMDINPDDDTCYYPGCNDLDACNYSDSAACNDNSCVYSGCTEVNACNYDPAAGCDDGSCNFPLEFLDCNNNCLSDIDGDSICDQLEVEGCTDSSACNYNAYVTQNDGSCLTFDECGICGGNSISGCTDSFACNYDALAICDDGSCQEFDACGVCGGIGVSGCMDMAACNYDMTATCDNGLCTFPGCIAPLACNFDATAGCDDGSCTFGGCLDTLACNYDANASCSYDNATCIYIGDTLVVFEDFDSLTAGDGIAAQNSFWNTWTGNIAAEDGTVSDVTAFSGNNSGEINGMTTDLILPILPSGPLTSGIVEASFKMNITAAGGYFNFLHQWSANSTTYEWACDVFFAANGQSIAVTGGVGIPGPVVEVGSWFDVKVIADLNTDNGFIFIDNQPVSFWQWSLNNADGTQGTNQIAAIDFYGTNDAGGEGLYYIDDVRVTHHIEGLACGTLIGVQEIANFSAPLVFPNPSNGLYQVVSSAYDEIKQLEVFDLTGRRVFSTTPNSSNTLLDLTSFSAGNYILKITGSEKIHSVMIQKN